MDSNWQMCNYAFDKLGCEKQITGINQNNDLARTCKRNYLQVYKDVLKRAHWKEAVKYAELTETEDTVECGDWEYVFDLPNDYLGGAQLISEEYHRSTKHRHLFEFDKEIIQTYLLCNELTNSAGDKAYIRYIYDISGTVTSFSTELVEAIALKLAAEMATPILKDKGARRRELLLEYEDLVLPISKGLAYADDGDNEDRGEYTAMTARIP